MPNISIIGIIVVIDDLGQAIKSDDVDRKMKPNVGMGRSP